MNDIGAIALWCALYILMASMLVYFLSRPAEASDFYGNYERIPLIDNRPPQVAQWERTPTIIVCEHAPITQRQIISAVNFWKKLGYRFYSTQYKHDPMNKCLMDEPMGYIVVHMVTAGIRLDETSLAQTRFYVDNITNKISYAKIYMRSDVRETVLEHELGHALGFLHFNKINHLMNKKWVQGGWDKEGLEKKRQ
jgi:predicted Zn-dependent protease|tara:strand:+ start:206 stop:790 length:585 start_codon:yes stop_codon:yes gene_type:complete